MDETTTREDAGAGAAPRPPLVRRTRGKLIAGVAGGIADRYGFDPIFVRLGFVLLALAGGVGLVLYAAAWWIVPPAARPTGAAERLLERLKAAPGWAGSLLIVLGLALIAPAVGIGAPVLWGLTAIVLGVTLYRGGEAMPWREPPVHGPPARSAETLELPAPAWSPPAHTPIARPVRRRRERSGLGWGAAGVALLATGAVAFLDDAGVTHLRLDQFLALPLLLLGVGLLVGGWRGRARGTIVLGLLLVPTLLLASTVDVPLSGGIGERWYRPAGPSEVASPYRLVAGDLTVDLRDYAFSPTEPLRIEASVAAGAIAVIVPREIGVLVDAEVEAGEIAIGGTYEAGVELRRRLRVGPGAVLLTLELDASLGRIALYRVEEP